MDFLLICLTWLGCLLMLFSLVSVCIDVLMRYFFNNPSGWILQISEYILLYIPFLSAAYVLKEDGHIKVDILVGILNQKTQDLFETITSLLGAGFLLILTYYGFVVTHDFYIRKVLTLKYLKIPEFLVIMVIPAGCLLFALQFIRRANKHYHLFKNQKEQATRINIKKTATHE